MSQNELRLAECLNEIFFDGTHSCICNILFQHSSLPVSLILQYLKTSQNRVPNDVNILKELKRALCTLIQLNIVKVKRTERRVLEYSYNWEALYSRLRFPHYLCLARLRCGTSAEAILEELLVAGQLPVLEILEKAYLRLCNQAIAEGKSSPSIRELCTAFGELLGQHLIEQTRDLVESFGAVNNDQGSQTELTSDTLENDEWDPFLAPCAEAMEQMADRLLTQVAGDGNCGALESDVSSCAPPPAKRIRVISMTEQRHPDTQIYYRVHLPGLNQAWRDELLAQAAGRKLDETCASLLRLMLRKVEVKAGSGGQLSRAEIMSSLPQELAALPRVHIDQYLALLCDDATSFVTRSGSGLYQCTLRPAWANLALVHIETLVQERYSARARRIFHMLVQKNYMEQATLESSCMMAPTECKELLYSMVADGLVQVTELSRGNDFTAKSAVSYLFHVDLESSARLLLQHSYQAMHNLLQRRRHEQRDNRRLLEKHARVGALAASLDGQLAELRVQAQSVPESQSKEEVLLRLAGLEEQQAELPNLLTPGETAQLERTRQALNRLSAAELELDETIFVLQTFLEHICAVSRGGAGTSS